MARPPIIREITVEDFEPEYSQLITRLSYVMNPFINEVVDSLDKNLDFDNLAFNLISIQITINEEGNVSSGNQVNVGLTNPFGTTVIGARNLTNPTVYPTSTPFISYSPIGNSIIQIDNITGLSQGTYQLNFIVY